MTATVDRGRCGSCGAAILWAQTATGRTREDGEPVKMPIDLEPVAGGNVELRDGVAHVIGRPDPAVKRYRSHFETCPRAAAHRRRVREREAAAPAAPPQQAFELIANWRAKASPAHRGRRVR